MTVVIGAGPDGLRAAAVIAARGGSVMLLQQADTAHGRGVPELPVDTGRMQIAPAERDTVEAVLGPLVEAADLRTGVLMRGRIHGLPLGLRAAAQLFDGAARAHVFGRWIERQVRNAATPLTGEGREERSYTDWLTRRIGEPAVHHLLRTYAERRWGAPANVLSSSVARVAHGPGDVTTGQVVGGGPGAALSQAIEVIRDSGGEIQTGVTIERMVVTDGRVSAVVTDNGERPIDGPLWIACPPSVIAGWLGEALPSDLQHDAAALRTADAVQVDLPGGLTDIPDVVHILDDDASFYRVVQTYGGERRSVFHATCPAGTADGDAGLPARFASEASRLGLGSYDTAGARVERLRDHVPIWTPMVHPRLRRLVLAWRELGIIAVGRRGVFAPIRADQEVILANRYVDDADPDQREAQRTLVEPPVLSSSLRTMLSDFVIR